MDSKQWKKLLHENTLNEETKLNVNGSALRLYLKNYKFSDYQKKNTEYGNTHVSRWEVDHFKQFVEDNMDNNNKIANKKLAKLLDLVNVDILDRLNNGGSGLNNNKEFKKYDNWRAALYDIWESTK